MVVQDRPEASSGVGTNTRVLSTRRYERHQTWQEGVIGQEVELVRPIERRIPQEEEHIRQQYRQRRWPWSFLCSCRRCNRVHNEKTHLKNRFTPENCALAFISGSEGSKESQIVNQVALKDLDVLLILASRSQLRVQILNRPLLHKLFGNFS